MKETKCFGNQISKKMMSRNVIFRLFMVLLACAAFSSVGQAKSKDEPIVYYIESAGTGAAGTYLVQVTATAKKAAVSDDDLCYFAVHGVLFRGFQDGTYGSQKPLAGSALAETEHKEFFDNFFSGGAYRTYVTMVSGSRRVVKTADKRYRVTATVTVQKSQLRKDLEKQGIVKALNSGF